MLLKNENDQKSTLEVKNDRELLLIVKQKTKNIKCEEPIKKVLKNS